jgi:hypothetical protein
MHAEFITLLSLCLVLKFAGFINYSTVSNIWKERKILGPWPIANFAIGNKLFNHKHNLAFTIDSLETNIILLP